MTTPITLTIAGSDSSGGAGIQADIKAISATGGYACSVLTALTAQNTMGVDKVMAIEPDFIRAQLDSVFLDLDVRAVKIGMLADQTVIRCVASALRDYRPEFIVLDPVMVATSGDLLLLESAVDTLIQELVPLATIITPNLFEGQVLLGRSVEDIPRSVAQCEALAQELMTLGCRNVLLKGGHIKGSSESIDCWHSTDSIPQQFSSPRVKTRNTHGTGCTLSSAMASYLAQGHSLRNAIRLAKGYLYQALQQADKLEVGQCAGPVNHFFMLEEVMGNKSTDLETLNES